MWQKNMPRLIEIIGPPGSGKSSISSELECVKKNDEQIFFHSGNFSNKNFYFNFLSKNLIRLKVLFKIIIFYFIFHKRIFLKKIYKDSFFFKVFFLFSQHLFSIEMLKKILPHDKYIIMEPGPIMYLIQDYFYINKKISDKEIKIYNRFFLNADFIINLYCNPDLLEKRIKLRKRGLPSRMKGLNNDQIKSTIKKSRDELDNYILNSNNLNVKNINIDTSNDIHEIKNKILNFINNNNYR